MPSITETSVRHSLGSCKQVLQRVETSDSDDDAPVVEFEDTKGAPLDFCPGCGERLYEKDVVSASEVSRQR